MVKRFIEEEFPIVELSVIGSKEKTTPPDNISGIHVWWARRPTSVCRALILSCLFDYPINKVDRKRIKKFIIDSCSDFKRLPNQITFKEKLNSLIVEKNTGRKFVLLDTFSGGTAIPLEAARIGLKSYAIDLNPIAVLIGKATTEYIQRYNKTLIIEIRKWWKILKNKLKRLIKNYYINPVNQNTILVYLWAKQIKCKNSNCNAQIPMISNLKLANKENKKIYLKPVIKKAKENNEINFIIQKNEEIDFEPKDYKIFSRGKITCPACGLTLANEEVMARFREKKIEDRLLIVIEKDEKSNDRIYRLSTDNDEEIFNSVKEKLESFKELIPNEQLPKEVRRWQVQNYGILKWKEFFNERQLLFCILYTEELKKILIEITNSYDDKEFSKAVILFLSFILSRIINYNSKFTHWHDSNEIIAQTWSRAGIFMKGNYPELNPFTDFSGTPIRYLDFIDKISENNLNFSNTVNIKQGNAMSLEFDDGSIDLLITDPPYYDAMLYANPSDFFYIWLKRCLESIFPELFLFSLTPKEDEIIQSRFRHEGDKKKAKRFYEDSLTKVLKEFHRVLKPNGIGVIMFTHKSVDAWEALIIAIIESNLTISAAWPIETEKKGGIRDDNKVALASSIAIVFKKIKKKEVIFFETNFKNILENELIKKLKNLLVDLEIYGADFFISAIGFSLNIFTRYKNVLSQKTGQTVKVSKFLDLVRKIVNDFLLGTVLEKNVIKSIDDITNLYIIWCWFFRNNGIDLDDALKLAQSFGVGELNDLRKKKLIKLKDKKFKLLLASNQAREDFLLKNRENLETLIANLHFLAILWKNNDKNLDIEVKKIEQKYGENIWKVGQALAEFFPSNHKEHNYLQGLLARFGKTKTKTDLKKWL